uniref:Uncharacterized protein n=1 Tax=Arundo donax TaxID=35708 RepID=A0A0A9FB18_ARUDO
MPPFYPLYVIFVQGLDMFLECE